MGMGRMNPGKKGVRTILESDLWRIAESRSTAAIRSVRGGGGGGPYQWNGIARLGRNQCTGRFIPRAMENVVGDSGDRAVFFIKVLTRYDPIDRFYKGVDSTKQLRVWITIILCSRRLVPSTSPATDQLLF